MLPLIPYLFLLILPSVRLEGSDDYEEFVEPSARQFRRPGRRPHRGQFDPQILLRKPRPKHLNPEKLKELLGNNFDPRWMSITEPEILVEPPEKEIPENRAQVTWLNEQFEKINITDELMEAGVSQDPEVIEGISKWFFKRALCPLIYRWDKMSVFSWPPYIKRGECLERHQFCSWPVSMHCVPVSSKKLKILRWQCRERKRKGRGKRPTQDGYHPRNERKKTRMKCDWYITEYPVTSECMCLC